MSSTFLEPRVSRVGSNSGSFLDALAQGILTGTNWEGLARQVELDLRVDIHAEASRVRCPTLILGCAHDQIVTRTRDLCDRIPDATFSEINAGHQAYFEASEEFAAKFLAFADGLHPPRRLSSSAS